MNDLLMTLHVALMALVGWILKVLYGMNARLATIEQWIKDRIKVD